MRIIFAGTPPFAAQALEALIAAGHEVLAVFTQPDRPSGRGMKLQPSAVKQAALQHGLPVLQPVSLKSDEVVEQIAGLRADVMVVAAYGLILPARILALPRLGCVNIHASLLPRWRGAAPIQRAIQAGDEQTGICIMQMDEGLDTGAVLLKKSCPIAASDTYGMLHDRLTQIGAVAIVEALSLLARGAVKPAPQSEEGANYAQRISKEETFLDWGASAAELARRVRSFNPSPVARTTWQGETLKIWQASALPAAASGAPGTLMDMGPKGIQVACGQGSLLLEVLQRAGGKPQVAAEFLKGMPLHTGLRMGSDA
jgi:methionyl-tRNA formyltransferase